MHSIRHPAASKDHKCKAENHKIVPRSHSYVAGDNCRANSCIFHYSLLFMHCNVICPLTVLFHVSTHKIGLPQLAQSLIWSCWINHTTSFSDFLSQTITILHALHTVQCIHEHARQTINVTTSLYKTLP